MDTNATKRNGGERLGITALMRAAVDEDPTVLLRLLLTDQYEASLFVRDKKGRTALDWARLRRNYQAVSILMQAMTRNLANSRLDAMHSPLELEVYIKETNKLQTTELFKAIRNRDVTQAVRILSENRLYREEVEGLGEVFFTDAAAHSGYTPLLIASGFNMIEVVDSLLEYKVPIDAENKFGHTAFTYACAAGNSDIARMLLFFGADVHHRTKEGRTGLHYCCMYAKARTVKVILYFLLERFATFRIEGHSLIDFDPSRWTKYAEILETLINTRDKNGKLATDLIPKTFPDAYKIEAKLRISGVTALPRLDQTVRDDRSLLVNRDYAQTDSSRADDASTIVSDLPDDMSFDADPFDAGDGMEAFYAQEEPTQLPELGGGSRVAAGIAGIADSAAGADADEFVLRETQQPVEGAGTGMPTVGDSRSEAGGERLEEMSRVSDVSGNTFQSAAQFSHDTDNLHAEGLHNLGDAHSVRTAQPLQQEVEIIKGLFTEVRDRIAVWLDAAKKETELMRRVPCPLNCGLMCTVESLTTHVRDDCPYRSLQCALCHRMVRFIDVKQHNAKLCPKRTIACPNAYQGCCERITFDSVETHLMLKCKLRKVACRQFCGAFVPYCKRDKHEEQHCKRRTVQCDQCKTSMSAHTYTEHLHEHCPQRLVRCRVSCGRSFRAHEIDAHEREECVRPCKWHCGQRIGPPEQLALHEATLCLEKPMQCRHGCGVLHLTVRDVRTHESLLCPKRQVACTRGCGAVLPACEMPAHLETFRGACAERPVRCPSNLIGWRIALLPDQQEGIVLQYRRQPVTVDAVTGEVVQDLAPEKSSRQLLGAHNGDDGPASEEKHPSGDSGEGGAVSAVAEVPPPVPRRTNQILVDQIFVRLATQQVWLDYWTTHYILLRKVQGDHLSKCEHIDLKFPCGWVVHSDLDHHLLHTCLNREVHIAGANDRQVLFVGQKTKFSDAVATAEKRLKFDHFVQTEVEQKSTEFCGFCSVEIDTISMDAHQKNDCPDYLLRCPFVCGAEVRRRDLPRHVEEQCPKRLVLCVDCNSKDLWAEELALHKLHQCDMRVVPCPLECDDPKVTACGVEAHTRKDCPNRPVQCTCGLTMKFRELDEHQRLHCNDRYYYCPQGCGVQVKQENEEYHTEFQCANKNFRYQKTVDCPNTCGAVMMIRDVLTHLSYACPRRIVECTLNCGNTVQLDKLEAHMVFCPMRILPCEPNMLACAQPLHAWFHVEPREEEDRPTPPIFEYEGSDDDRSVFGDSVVGEGASIRSHDGKRMITYSNTDLVRAGLSSPAREGTADSDHPLGTRSEILAELQGVAAITDVQTKKQITKRIVRTDQLILQLLPEEAAHRGDDDKDQVTLFARKEVNIQFDKRPGQNTFGNLRVRRGDAVSPRLDEHDHNPAAIYYGARSLALDSSVYHDGYQMKFRHHLRMHCCKLHNCTLIFAALRHHDFALMEHLCKQIKDSEDIDTENIYGDTALTLACRMGKLNFVELLVQHAADINKETSNGRTALIEAAKAPVENIAVLEYIIENGCLVNYKTHKHQRTALDWARRLNRPKSVRILELAIIVQHQANKIFFAISTGKNDYVKDLIKEGEFFDPNGEPKYYAEMKRYADLEDDAHDMVGQIRQKLESRGNAADVALERSNEANDEYIVAQDALEDAFRAEEVVNQLVSREFALFEKNSLRLMPVDVQEVAAQLRPEYLLRMAAFGYCIMFGVLESDDWHPVAPCNIDNSTKWWPVFRKELLKPNEVVRKIQAFTLARLEGGRAVDLISRGKQLFEDMVEYLAGERKKRLLQQQQGTASVASPPGSPQQRGRLRKTQSTSGMPLLLKNSPDKQSTASRPDLHVEPTEGAEVAGRNDTSQVSEIPDADWDSEAEDPDTVSGAGAWVMGDWVPAVRKKERWWERDKAAQTAARDTTHYQKAKHNNKFVYLSDEVISSTVRPPPVEVGTVVSKPRTPATRSGTDESVDGSGVAGPSGSLTNSNFALVTTEDLLVLSELQGDSGQSPGGSSSASPKQRRRKLQRSKSSKAGSPGRTGALVRAKSSRGSSRSPSRSRSRRHHRSGSSGGSGSWSGDLDAPQNVLDIPIEEHLSVLDYETFECLPFIEAMFFMFKAIVRYAEDRENLAECKRMTAQRAHECEDASEQSAALRAAYQEEFNTRAELEGLLIDYMKKERFYKARVKSYMDKVRVARLLNEVSMNGHTAISWAAAVGAYDIVEEMLTHGATVGFPVPLLNLTATFLQKTYRIYKLNCAFRYKPPSQDDDDYDPNRPPPPKVDSIQFVRDMTLLKEEREKILNKVVFLRSRTRFPIPEAVYAGKWEIVHRIYERRLYHAHFANTWIFPSAPFPYLRKHDKKYERTKMSIREVLTYGMNDNAAGCYVAGIGWVGPNDHREPFGETQQKVAELLLDLHTKNQAFLANRKRIRLLSLERKNQRTGERAMGRAIKAKDFRRCMDLAERRGITIDLETPEGYTVLLAAAEENVDAVNHVYMRNDDGRECLAVEFLLDRQYYRPSVNQEGVVSGHNALIRATILSRAPVVEALLDRGANIDYTNRAGRTALHYAAAAGDAVCTRILVERFADKTIRDANGQTPYEIAESENFSNIMKLLSQFKGGFLGPVQISRGRVNNITKCPLGCGMNLGPREQDAHCLVCEWRPAACPNDCGDPNLQWKELPDHLERFCSRRILQCQECDEEYEARFKEKHDSELCGHRLVQCSFGCGYDCKLCDIPRHQVHCSWRVIPCPLGCSADMRAKDSQHHVKEECENRRVPCPYRCRGLVVYKLIPIHLETMCQNRPVFCTFCGTTVTKQTQERHEQECDMRLTPCVDKCSELVPYRDMALHQRETCVHRYVECPQKCGIKVRVKNLDFHTQTQCAERLSPCENGCVIDENVPFDERVVVKVCAKVMHLHLKYECPERLNRCSLCQQYVKAKRFAVHDQDECPRRQVHCRVEGCRKEMPIEEREQHERHTCRFRLVVCKQDCGELIPYLYSGIHMKSHCRNRYCACPLKCAADSLRFHELEGHLTHQCPRRHTLDLRNAESRTTAALAGMFQRSKSSTSSASAAALSGSGISEKARPQSGGSDGGRNSSAKSEVAQKYEVRKRVNNMSAAVADSLKMLALGDRAWTSNLGSRHQSAKNKTKRSPKRDSPSPPPVAAAQRIAAHSNAQQSSELSGGEGK